MLAYANPGDRSDETQRADGFGLAVWDFPREVVEFHCYPRFPRRIAGVPEEFPGWPVIVPAPRQASSEAAAAKGSGRGATAR